jgi:HAD superfamily hydrolase (TIGR01509 family)
MKAVIFDLDGVLVPTDVMHKTALQNAMYLVLNSVPPGLIDLSEKSQGSTIEKVDYLQSIYGFSNNLKISILNQKDKIFQSMTDDIKVLPNVIKCLDFLNSRHIPMAIASNSRHVNISKVLGASGLSIYFGVVVSAEDVANRKPAPDILFEVYRQLGIDGKETLFVEDSDEGAEAGHRSPSTVIRIDCPKDLKASLFKAWIK